MSEELTAIKKELVKLSKQMKDMQQSIDVLSDTIDEYTDKINEIGNMGSLNMENLRLFVYEFKDIMQEARNSLKEKK